MKARKPQRKRSGIARVRAGTTRTGYAAWSGSIAALLDESRRQAARSVNAILTATYWEIGRRIVEFVQAGEARAEYGDEVLDRLSVDLTKRFGKGFGRSNLFQMKAFYLAFPEIVQTPSGQLKLSTERVAQKVQTVSGQSSVSQISQTLSAELEICQTPSGKSLVPISATLSRKSSVDLTLYLEALARAFPLSWSHYVRLLSVEKPEARKFYEAESLQGGWSVRQLDRQVSTLFYERTALSKNKAKMLTTGAKPRPEDAVTIQIERFKFRFYSSDVGEPPHVHVLDGNKVAKIWLQPLSVEYNRGYNAAELNYVRKLTRQNQTKLLEAWNDYFA